MKMRCGKRTPAGISPATPRRRCTAPAIEGQLFGGPGLAKIVEMMGPIGYLVTIGEFFGGLGLIVGFLSRFSAASLIVIMIGAVSMVHAKNGFFLDKGGFEYNIALIGLLCPILLCGPGRFAIGRFLPLPKSAGTDRPILILE